MSNLDKFLWSLLTLVPIMFFLMILPEGEARMPNRDIALCLRGPCQGNGSGSEPSADAGFPDSGTLPDTGVFYGDDQSFDFDGNDENCTVTGLPISDDATFILVGSNLTRAVGDRYGGLLYSGANEPFWLMELVGFTATFPQVSVDARYYQDNPSDSFPSGAVVPNMYAVKRTQVMFLELDDQGGSTSYEAVYSDFDLDYPFSGTVTLRDGPSLISDPQWQFASIGIDGAIVGGYDGQFVNMQMQVAMVVDRLLTLSEKSEIMLPYGKTVDPRTVTWAGDIVAWWQAGAENFDGVTLNDASGNNHDMTCSNMEAADAEGIPGNEQDYERWAVELDNTNEWMTAQFSTKAVRTLAVVLRSNNTANGNVAIQISETDGAGSGLDKNYGIVQLAGSISSFDQTQAWIDPNAAGTGENSATHYSGIGGFGSLKLQALSLNPAGNGTMITFSDYATAGTVVQTNLTSISSSTYDINAPDKFFIGNDGTNTYEEHRIMTIVASDALLTATQLDELVNATDAEDPCDTTFNSNITSCWIPNPETYDGAGGTWSPSGGTEQVDITLTNMGPENLVYDDTIFP